MKNLKMFTIVLLLISTLFISCEFDDATNKKNETHKTGVITSLNGKKNSGETITGQCIHGYPSHGSKDLEKKPFVPNDSNLIDPEKVLTKSISNLFATQILPDLFLKYQAATHTDNPMEKQSVKYSIDTFLGQKVESGMIFYSDILEGDEGEQLKNELFNQGMPLFKNDVISKYLNRDFKKYTIEFIKKSKENKIALEEFNKAKDQELEEFNKAKDQELEDYKKELAKKTEENGGNKPDDMPYEYQKEDEIQNAKYQKEDEIQNAKYQKEDGIRSEKAEKERELGIQGLIDQISKQFAHDYKDEPIIVNGLANLTITPDDEFIGDVDLSKLGEFAEKVFDEEVYYNNGSTIVEGKFIDYANFMLENADNEDLKGVNILSLIRALKNVNILITDSSFKGNMLDNITSSEAYGIDSISLKQLKEFKGQDLGTLKVNLEINNANLSFMANGKVASKIVKNGQEVKEEELNSMDSDAKNFMLSENLEIKYSIHTTNKNLGNILGELLYTAGYIFGENLDTMISIIMGVLIR